MNFRLDKSDILYTGKVFDLKVDKIEYDTGNSGIREVVVHPGGSVVLPVTDDGKIVMVTRFDISSRVFMELVMDPMPILRIVLIFLKTIII